MDEQPHYQPSPFYWPVEPAKPKRKRGKSILIGVALIVGLLLALLFLFLVLFAGYPQSRAPYPWDVTIHSGYERATTLFGVPVGATKHVQLHITLTNMSASDTLSPNDLTWTLIDANTNENYAGTMEGNGSVLMLPGQSSDFSLDFAVPIASTVFTLNLSGPSGHDPTTWPIRFSA